MYVFEIIDVFILLTGFENVESETLHEIFRIMPSVDLLSLFGFRRSKGLWNSDSVHNRKKRALLQKECCFNLFGNLPETASFWLLLRTFLTTHDGAFIDMFSIRYAWVTYFFLFLNQFIYRTTALEWELLWKKMHKKFFQNPFSGMLH